MKPVEHATLKPLPFDLATDKQLPGDILQINLVVRLQKSTGCTFILTTKDVFSKYLFAVTLLDAGASNVAKQLFQTFKPTSYKRKIILLDIVTAFTARLMKELCQIFETNIDFATMPLSITHRLLGHLSAHMRLSDNIWTSMRIISNAIGITLSICSFCAQHLLSLFYRVYSHFHLPWSRIHYCLRSSF